MRIACAFIFILLFLPSAAATFTCTVSSSYCTGDQTEIMKVYQPENSHVGVAGSANVPLSLCCSDTVAILGNACTGTQGKDYSPLLNLYQGENSHAQLTNYTGTDAYSIPVCLSIPIGGVSTSCQVASDCSAITGSTCVLALYQGTNSHVASCTSPAGQALPFKLCCTVKGDNTPPQATLAIENGAAATSNPTVTLNLQYSDPESGIANPGCEYKETGSYTPKETCAPTRSFTLTNQDGVHTVFYRVTSNLQRNNQTEVTDTIILDRSLPTLQVNAMQNPTNDNTPAISGTATDNTSNVAKIQYRVLNSSTLAVILDWTDVAITPARSVAFSFSPTALADGGYTFSVRVFDEANNVFELPTATSTVIDTTPPVTTDSSDGQIHSSPYLVTLTCKDAHVGCAQTLYCVYDEGATPCTPVTAGTAVNLGCPQGSVCRKIVRYGSTDILSNTETVHDSLVNILDTTKPSCTMTTLPAYTLSTTIPLSWTGFDPNGKKLTSFTVFDADSTGNFVKWQDFPSTTTAANFSAPAEGTWQFYCVATNEFNVTGPASAIVSTVADTSPPQLTVSPLPLFVNSTSFKVNWTGSDSVSKVSSYKTEYAEGAGSFVLWNTYAPTTTADIFGPVVPVTVQDGKTYNIRVTAFNFVNLSTTSQVLTTTIDTSLPSCSLTSLPAWTTKSVFALNWSGSDAISGPSQYEVQISVDAATWDPLYAGTDTSTYVRAADGTKFFARCRTQDKAGNLGLFSTFVNTSIDTGPPQITVQSPATAGIGQQILVTADVTDPVGVRSVVLMFNGAIVAPTNQSGSTWTWSLPPASQSGTQSFTINATDTSGNEKIKVFTIDVVECVSGETKSCGSNIGTCVEGTRTCVNNVWGVCVGEVTSSTETCNGLDDDCDGTVDDQLSAPSCTLTSGVCAGSKSVCTGPGGWACSPDQYGSLYQPSETSCDGVDNDCNGKVDEFCTCTPGDRLDCGTDTGACQKGVQVCGSDQSWGTCEGSIDPVAEVCGDGVDNSCDGLVDEGCTGSDHPTDIPSDQPQDHQSETLYSSLPTMGIIISLLLAVGTGALILYYRKGRKAPSWSQLMERYR